MNPKTSSFVISHAALATMQAGQGYGLIEDGAVVVSGGEIVWVGKSSDIPTEFAKLEWHDLEGRLVTPGLIDCHTHVVFGGNRAREFEMRLNGATYEDIARAGGGT